MEKIYSEKPDYPIFNKIKSCSTLLVNFSIALFITMLLLRVMEFINISYSNDLPTDISRIIIEAVIYDIIFFLKIIPFLFLPFFLVFLTSQIKRPNFWAFGLIGTLVLIIYLLLIKYFATALVPLGSDLFGYSIVEIKQTISGSSKPDITSVLIIGVILAIFWTLLSLIYNKTLVKPTYALILLIAGILLSLSKVSGLPKNTPFKSDFSYNLAVNKLAFFIEKSTEYFYRGETLNDINIVNHLEDNSANGYKYLNDEYPFLRKEETVDVLGNFFKIDSSSKPNIVFLQVEGLGRAFSGPNAYLGSFTPFLDELAGKGIYFENFLASQGRTFATLPSILGSLPFAEKGFCDLGTGMPKFFSLQNILKHNGYQNKFYCGYDMEFDNQDKFMRNSGANLIVGINDFGNGFKKSPGGAMGASWGYADGELIQKSLQMETAYPQEPFFTYIETMSMHTPYYVPDQQQFIKLFEKRMEQLDFDEAKKKSYRQYENIYSSIIYTDESLRLFFTEYEKLPSYKNTIFIITGDHRLPEIPMSTKIDRYHVPLIIYSPMLNHTAKIRSISSHLDITPSVLALLKNSYKLNTPLQVTWIGSGLDTNRNFRNIHKYPLKQTKTDLHNYISGLYFIDQKNLFSISDGLNLEPIENEEKMNEIQIEFNNYKARNERFIKDLKLIPDSLYKAFK